MRSANTRLDLELALVGYIGWYNSRRRHRSLRQQGKERIRRLAPTQVLDLYSEQSSADRMLPRNPGRANDRAVEMIKTDKIGVCVAQKGEFLIGEAPAQSLSSDKPGIGPLGGVMWNEATVIVMLDIPPFRDLHGARRRLH